MKRRTLKWGSRAAGEVRQRQELRRETILEVAARSLNRAGYRGTSVEDIASELNVSKAALYYYVKNKEQMFVACHEAALDVAMEGLREAHRTGRSPEEKLRTALRWYVEAATGTLKGAVVVSFEKGAVSPAVERRLIRRRDEYELELRRLVEEGIRSGVFCACDAKIVTFAILGAIAWIPKWYSPQGEREPKAIADIISDFVVRGLRCQGDVAPVSGS
jgi:TetR/AcrR family transcriptional regulator